VEVEEDQVDIQEEMVDQVVVEETNQVLCNQVDQEMFLLQVQLKEIQVEQVMVDLQE
jgi:hypothetical protein